MFKKRLIKISIVFCLVFATVIVGSLSCFAYEPVFTLDSDDWDIGSYYAYSQIYPNRVSNFTFHDSVYSVPGLEGETFYYSKYGVDTTTDLVVDFVPPAFNITWSDDKFGLLYSTNDSVLWFLYCDSSSIDLNIEYYFANDNQSGSVDHMKFYYTLSESCNVKLFSLSYPYTSWKTVYNVYNTGSALNKLQCRDWHWNVNSIDDVSFIWCSDTVFEAYTDSAGNFNHVSHVLISNDGCSYSDLFSRTFTFTVVQDVYLFSGALYSSFTGEELNCLNSGQNCILINNLGCVIGSDSVYCSAIYSMRIYDGSLQVADIVFYGRDVFSPSSENVSDTLLQPYDLSYGDYNFRDVVNFAYFSYDDVELLNSSDYTVVFEFLFISDGYNLFFPGTLEIISFDSYDSQMKHDEIVGSIDSAAGVITGSIDNAKDDLSSEIVSAADSISSAIDNGTVDIVDSVNDAASIISDGLSDVSDSIDSMSDKITDKLEDTKNGILDGIKSFFIPSEDEMIDIKDEWDKLLKSRFGALYEVSGIISDFGSQLDTKQLRTRGIKNTITMPEVTVDLVGTPFVFGGYEVPIVPEGFEVLVTALKGITSIVCTLSFVNALRKKYDKIIGGLSV